MFEESLDLSFWNILRKYFVQISLSSQSLKNGWKFSDHFHKRTENGVKFAVISVGWGRGQSNSCASENKFNLNPLWTLYKIRSSNFGKRTPMLQNLQFLQSSWICFCWLNSFKVVLSLLSRKSKIYYKYYLLYLYCVFTVYKCYYALFLDFNPNFLVFLSILYLCVW